MKRLEFIGRKIAAYALGGALAVPLVLHAAETDISNGPLGQAATPVNPNLLLILDDSLSMGRQFTPDYVSTYQLGSGLSHVTRNCFDSLDGDNTLSESPSECWAGDPPAMSPDFNVQYYNPEIRYFPAVNHDNSPRISMSCQFSGGFLDTSVTPPVCKNGWTKVPTDNVSAVGMNKARKDLHSGGGIGSHVGAWGSDHAYVPPLVATMNLTTGFPDRVWCSSQAGVATDPTQCKTNSGYTYPDLSFGYGLDTLGRRKYKFGAPYYYRIAATEYCADATLKDCVASETPTIVAGKSYNVPAPVRFCTDSTRTNCQAKRDAINAPNYLYPKYLGRIVGTGVAAVAPQGKITLTNPQADNAQGNLTSVRVNGTIEILTAAPLVLPAGQTASQWATLIASSIGNGYSATASNGVVTVTHPTAGALGNGWTIAVGTNVTGRSPASITLNVISTNRSSKSPQWGTVSQFTIEGLSFLGGTIVCDLVGCNNSNAGTRNATMAGIIRTRMTPPPGWTVGGSGTEVVITAPAGTGSEKNGIDVVVSDSNTTLDHANMKLGGGTTTGDVNLTTQNFSGGSDPSQHADVGRFVRTDIVPGQTYNRFPGRSDCVTSADHCTYEEEMTNFANWFAYYRTRLQMAKTAIGRAFAGLSQDYRVGFMTINFNATHYRPVAPFTPGAGGEKDLWYQRLYAADTPSSTPLKTALSRAGRYFGNQNPDGMGATPINSACQPNYAVLTSDGYWNDSSTGTAVDLSKNNIGDADGDGVSNTLADVAHYYYVTDLSTGTTGPGAGFNNQVPASGIDIAPHQHMTTFTVGMGVSGSLLFHPAYLERGNSIDYDAIIDGDPATTPNQWPTPKADTETTIDDMWHAAVNGKGRFFSAQNPVALASGLAEVLSSVQRRIGAGAAAATSNLQPVAGDNFAFTAQYQTVEWSGDLKARTIGLTDGFISARELWSASEQLDQRTDLNRKIYTFDPGDTDATANVTIAPPFPAASVSRAQNANKLRSFCPAMHHADAKCDDGGLLTQPELDDHFDPMGGANGALIQAGTWAVLDPRRSAASKESLVRYLRGDTTNEMTTGGVAVTDLYRNRAHLLGDIVNAQPAYVKNSPFSYTAATDPYYIDFRNSTNGTAATRKGTVYVAANDGMLHAFETDPDNVPYYQNAGVSTADDTSDDKFTGTLDTDPIAGEGAERWAYVPSVLFPSLEHLAEENYASTHRFYVDGSPQVGDVCFGHTLSSPCSSVNNWHTILVGGLNAGGRGYYALDITNPDVPKGLWEIKGGNGTKCLTDSEANSGSFTEDCNIGLTFGNPIITKRASDGRWVVLFTSGYNNVTPGDGQGYLYVVDAETGRIQQRLTTGKGDSTTPSGLARINAWVNNALLDNTALAVYGGDLLGNVWRFQLDDTASVPRDSVTLLATVQDAAGVGQPITTRPELAEVSAQRVVFVGTGRFLGDSDKDDNQRHTIYAIKDTMAGTSMVHDMKRGAGGIPGFVQQTFEESGTDQRIVKTVNPVNFATDSGWFVDLPDGGSGDESAERVNVDPILQLGTLVVPSNVPSKESCTAGGFGWLNFLDFATGGTVQNGLTDTPVSVRIAGSLVVGINVVKIGNTVKTIVTTADNQQITKDTPVVATSVSGRRVTWRELFVE
jgi:type IV pilus assembly protein PilY1